MQKKHSILKALPLIIIFSVMFCFFYFNLYRYLTFENLRDHRQLFLDWTKQHYFKTVCIYIGLFTLAEAVAIPGSTFFAIVGGFLFGIGLATFYAVLSTTLGGAVFFLAIKTSLSEWLEKKADQSGQIGQAVKRWEKGFRENAFSYLLMLRLFPFFPFWIVNAVAGLVGIRFLTFIVATAIGIIPGILLCVAIGRSLDHVFSQQVMPDMATLFRSHFFFPLMGLVILSFLPLVFKWLESYFSSKKRESL